MRDGLHLHDSPDRETPDFPTIPMMPPNPDEHSKVRNAVDMVLDRGMV